jgi:hypothetical protein
MIVRTGTCMLCGKPGSIDIADEDLAKRAIDWTRLPAMRRPFIQVALPELTPGQREQLMNGSHEECFDKAFPEDEEEE